MLVLYGIKNCDTCRKAARWLDENGFAHRFHDYRQDGLTRGQLEDFAGRLGWDRLLNRNSASWRALDGKRKAVSAHDDAITLMLDIPTLIKRPVLDTGDRLILGFKSGGYAGLL